MIKYQIIILFTKMSSFITILCVEIKIYVNQFSYLFEKFLTWLSKYIKIENYFRLIWLGNTILRLFEIYSDSKKI